MERTPAQSVCTWLWMGLCERGAMTERILIANRTVSNSPRKEEGMGTESSPCMRMVMV